MLGGMDLVLGVGSGELVGDFGGDIDDYCM